MSEDHWTRRERRSGYAVLVLIVMVVAAGRIATVSSREGETAFLSANDRSRWCTIAALVEDGTYAIDRLIQIRDSRGRRPWYTIDLVRHRGEDGKLHYYSSKPPLFPTMVAGVYAVVHGVTGMTLTAQPIYVTRIVLAVVNLPLLGLWMLAMVRSIELVGGGRVGGSDWTRRLLVGAICFGTLLLPFAWSLSNHLPAATASAVTLWIYLAAAERIRGRERERSAAVPWWWWLVAGIAAAFAAANELPAMSMLVFWAILVIWLDRWAFLPFVAGAVIVAIAFFGTNWWAHQSFRPPYAHRGVGPTVATLRVERASLAELADGRSAAVLDHVRGALRDVGVIGADEDLTLSASSEPGRWIVTVQEDRLFALVVPEALVVSETPATAETVANPEREGELRDEAGVEEGDRSGEAITVRLAEWDDWYEYPGSYWRGAVRRGVDRGEPSRGTYLFQMTFGHHGLFSLTPWWLLVPWGWYLGIRWYPAGLGRLLAATATATLVCIAFYVARPEIDRNYGGVSITFRWLIWLYPFWVLASVPAVQALSRSGWGRGVAWLLLGCSVFSVAASLESPWQHPWLYRFWGFLGWIAD